MYGSASSARGSYAVVDSTVRMDASTRVTGTSVSRGASSAVRVSHLLSRRRGGASGQGRCTAGAGPWLADSVSAERSGKKKAKGSTCVPACGMSEGSCG